MKAGNINRLAGSFALGAALAAGACVLSASAAAQSVPTAIPTTPVVTLSVSEEVSGTPDIATISTGVQTRAPTAQAAMSQNASQMDKLIAAIAAAGIARKDIQTSGINLNPQYDYSNQAPGQGPRFIGYEASNQLTVKIRQINKAGDIIDKLVGAGATNVNGPSFSIDDNEPLLLQARTKALKTAKARATFYATQSGYRSARLIALSETGSIAGPPVPMMAMMARADSAATKIEPGQLQVGVTLTAQYALEP